MSLAALLLVTGLDMGTNRSSSCCEGPSVAAEGGPQFTRSTGKKENEYQSKTTIQIVQIHSASKLSSSDAASQRRLTQTLYVQKVMIELECQNISYGSEGDETAFFSWAESIPAVRSIHGLGTSLFLQLDDDAIEDESLREFLALFDRYGVEMSQLRQFLSAENRSWFMLNTAFWYEGVFGDI